MPQMTRLTALPHPPEPDWKHRLAEIDAAARQREARQLDAVIDTALQVLDDHNQVKKALVAHWLRAEQCRERRARYRAAIMCRGDHDPM